MNEDAEPHTPDEPERVRTDVAEVDEVIAAVEELEERPLEEHVACLRDRARRAASRPGHAGRTAGRLRLTVPPRRLRLDAELVRRGLARSREHAAS